MRNMQFMGVALLALFAFGALTEASASAVTTLLALWLAHGAPAETELLVEITGELLLEDSKVPIIGKATVLCGGTFDGWVGSNSLEYISEVLSATGVAISSTPLTGEPLTCTAQTGCETSTSTLVWPVGFPVETEVELLEQAGGPFFEDVIFPSGTAGFGYEITNCLVLGISMEDECTSPLGTAELKLEGTTLLGIFSQAFTELAEQKLALCTQSKEESGIVEGEGSFVLSGGSELEASSEAEIEA